jgi:anti-sigma-K factor RskA
MATKGDLQAELDSLRDEIGALDKDQLERWMAGEDKHLAESLTADSFPEEASIKAYLLGDLKGDERAQFVKRLETEENLAAQLQIVEDELIDDYALGRLSFDEEEKFARHFEATSERKRKFNHATIMKEVAKANAGTRFISDSLVTPIQKPVLSRMEALWQSLQDFMRSPILLAGAAACILLFLIAGALWLFSQRSNFQEPLIVTAPTNEGGQNVNQSPDLNQSADSHNSNQISSPLVMLETAPTLSPKRIESPPRNTGQRQGESPRPSPEKPIAPSSVVFALVSGVTRNQGQAAEAVIRPSTKLIRLKLTVNAENTNQNFQIIVQDSNGNEIARRDKLKPTKKGGALIIDAAFPASSFKPDDYTVILNAGIKDENQEVDRYFFRILK